MGQVKHKGVKTNASKPPCIYWEIKGITNGFICEDVKIQKTDVLKDLGNATLFKDYGETE